MNRRRYDYNNSRFDKSDNYDRKTSRMNSNSKDDYRRHPSSSSKYFDDSKYSSNFRRPYKNTSSRGDNRIKKSRNDDSRLSSSFMSTHRRNDLRPKTPPPPTIRSSGSNYNRGSHHHRNNDSIGSFRRSYSPSRRRTQVNFSSRNPVARYNPRNRANANRDPEIRPKIIRRKIIVSTSRKLNTLRNDRSRIIRLARLKRNRDSLKSKTTPSKKLTREEINEENKKTISSNNDREEENSNKNGQDEKEEKEEDQDNDKAVDKKNDLKDKKDEESSKKSDEDLVKSRRNQSSKRDSVSSERKQKPFIKLVCVHCRIKSRTFSEYQHHLYSRTHRMAMRRVSIRQKTQLSRMRLDQRNAQRELEENTKDDLGEQQYCLLCRLNYRTGKAKHQISDHHKTMKKFLMPYCSTCHIAFKSPTVYQSHRCSLEHIKKKARDNKSDSEDSESEMKVDLKDFTTVDSIGEIDDDLNESETELNISEINIESLGLESVKKVEALYCETCETFINHDKNIGEEIILKHCRTNLHLKLLKRINDKKMNEDMDNKEQINMDDSEILAKQEEIENATSDVIKNEIYDDDDVDNNIPNDKTAMETNDEDIDDENILNIDIQSDNCNDNGIMEESTNNAAE